jgi:hypothetical protein
MIQGSTGPDVFLIAALLVRHNAVPDRWKL